MSVLVQFQPPVIENYLFNQCIMASHTEPYRSDILKLIRMWINQDDIIHGCKSSVKPSIFWKPVDKLLELHHWTMMFRWPEGFIRITSLNDLLFDNSSNFFEVLCGEKKLVWFSKYVEWCYSYKVELDDMEDMDELEERWGWEKLYKENWRVQWPDRYWYDPIHYPKGWEEYRRIVFESKDRNKTLVDWLLNDEFIFN